MFTKTKQTYQHFHHNFNKKISHRLPKIKLSTNNFLMQKSIHTKLTSLIMTACTISIFLTCIAFITSKHSQLKSSIRNDLTTLAQAIGNRNSAALSFKNKVKIDFSLLQNNPAIQSACLYDSTGKIFATYSNTPLKPTHCPSPKYPQANFIHNELHLFHHIKKRHLNLGSIYIKSHTNALYHNTHNDIITASFIIAIMLIIIYNLSRQISKHICKPITNIISATQKVADDKSRNTKIFLQETEEINSLANIINDIATHHHNDKQLFDQKSQHLKNITNQYNQALKYYQKESIEPLLAAINYKDTLQKQQFGPVSPQYIESFETIQSANIQHRYIARNIIKLCSIAHDVHRTNNTTIYLNSVINKQINKFFNKSITPNITINSNLNPIQLSTTTKHILESHCDTILSIIELCIKDNCCYHLTTSTSPQKTESTELTVHICIKQLNIKQTHANDNSYNIDIAHLNSSHNNHIIDSKNPAITGLMHVTHFLNKLYNTHTTIEQSENTSTFKTKLPSVSRVNIF